MALSNGHVQALDEDIDTEYFDVIVVGAGNAGFSAASTAAQTLRHHQYNDNNNNNNNNNNNTDQNSPPRVLLLEKAPYATSGGNTYYTAGAYRFCFDGLQDLRPILSHDNKPNIPDDLADRIEMTPYTAAEFHADLDRVTQGRTDQKLADVLVSQSREAVEWIAANGGKWELSFHRQAYEVDGKYKFWGGLVVCFAGGGKGLVKWHEELASREKVEVRYDSAVTDLVIVEQSQNKEQKVTGVKVLDSASGRRYRAMSRGGGGGGGGVVLATGGFQASSELRSKWLGPQWAHAHVRGSPTNTGDGHYLTILSPAVRAQRAGFGSGCHSVCWDSASPRHGGDRHLTNQFTKSGYPLGIMVNAKGQRFVDEGADLRNYTYAVFGAEVLKQPAGGVAWQIYDSKGAALLRKEEYDPSVTRLITAPTIDDLAATLARDGLEDPDTLVRTITNFNTATQHNLSATFDPSIRDNLSTTGLSLKKSNWALPLTVPPFTAVKITCGITFTFDGVAINPQTAGVLKNTEDRTVPGLYCCGELVGGLFWGNYPGGSGLTAGTVFGRIAGRCAAERSVVANANANRR